MQYDLECQYCGKRWEQAIWNPTQLEKLECPTCSERKILKARKREEQSGDVFGYRFSPPIPPKPEPKEEKDPYNTYDYHYLHNGD